MILPRRDGISAVFWGNGVSIGSPQPSKKAKTSLDDSANDKVEIARLRKELEESQAVIERWQTVNNQLMLKLKSK
jgi:hypothetical protein